MSATVYGAPRIGLRVRINGRDEHTGTVVGHGWMQPSDGSGLLNVVHLDAAVLVALDDWQRISDHLACRIIAAHPDNLELIP